MLKKNKLSPPAGKSTVAVSVSPKQIKYGFITVRSERWKTLRSMTLLDIAYLDADLRYTALPLGGALAKHHHHHYPLKTMGMITRDVVSS